MNKKQITYLVAAVAVAALSVFNFTRGDVLWGALLAGAAVCDVVISFTKAAEN